MCEVDDGDFLAPFAKKAAKVQGNDQVVLISTESQVFREVVKVIHTPNEQRVFAAGTSFRNPVAAIGLTVFIGVISNSTEPVIGLMAADQMIVSVTIPQDIL